VRVAGRDHPLRFVIEKQTLEPSRYVHIRGRLEAKINRAVFYDLVELGREVSLKGQEQFGIWSSGVFFPMADVAELTR